MGPAPDGLEPGPLTGGLARALARATRPRVAVPRSDAGMPRPVSGSAFLEAPNRGGPQAPPPAPGVVADRRPATDVSNRDEVAAAPAPAPRLARTVADPLPPDVAPLQGIPRAAALDAAIPVPLHVDSPPGPPEPGAGAPRSLHPEVTASRAPEPRTGPPPPRVVAPSSLPATLEPGPDPTTSGSGPEPPTSGSGVGLPEPAAATARRSVPQPTRATRVATELNRSASDRPDRSDPPQPAHAAPPVVIGRIEVHVDAPVAATDPFAGCRVVAAGLTVRRGGGW